MSKWNSWVDIQRKFWRRFRLILCKTSFRDFWRMFQKKPPDGIHQKVFVEEFPKAIPGGIITWNSWSNSQKKILTVYPEEVAVGIPSRNVWGESQQQFMKKFPDSIPGVIERLSSWRILQIIFWRNPQRKFFQESPERFSYEFLPRSSFWRYPQNRFF